MDPRKYNVSLFYNGVDASEEIGPYLSTFSYTDAIDESDTIVFELTDREGTWARGWIPEKEDRITPSICMENWQYSGEKRTIICGDFMVDDFNFSGPPDALSINGISSPVNMDFKETRRSHTWMQVTLQNVSQEIAGRYGLELVFEGDDIPIAKMEQSRQTDSDFLKKLVEKYGFAMKVYSKKLVIFQRKLYEDRQAVCVIAKNEVRKWSYKSSMMGTYTGAKVSYTDPKTKETIEVLVGKEGRMYSTTEKADSIADAQRIGENAIRNANRKEKTITLTLNPPILFFASDNVKISGFGKLDGIYQVEKIVHKLSRSEYSIQANGWWLRDSDDETGDNGQEESVESSSQGSQGQEYVVKQGDTLWDLAGRFYGDSTKYGQIYEANKDVIEETARRHGKSGSGQGYWIWEGTALFIP